MAEEWKGFAFDEWKHDLSIGWYNPEDDAATPTEDALLNEIKKLREDRDNLHMENIGLKEGKEQLRSERDELRWIMDGLNK
jgi:hypothetical protein